MYRNAAQQKNCTRPTVQNAFGAWASSLMKPSFLPSCDFWRSKPWNSAYSFGGISFTFIKVYRTQRMRMAAPQ